MQRVSEVGALLGVSMAVMNDSSIEPRGRGSIAGELRVHGTVSVVDKNHDTI